jgi:hypothetical protein
MAARSELPSMLRSSKAAFEEIADASFDQILAEVGRADGVGDGFAETPREFANFAPSLSVDALFSIEDGQAAAAGGAAIWEEALAWFEEQEEPPPPLPEQRLPKDESPEGILRELGLTDRFTREEIGRARRLFMWRNHPDRHGEAERENATRRVAIANMLLDRAQARLAGERGA